MRRRSILHKGIAVAASICMLAATVLPAAAGEQNGVIVEEAGQENVSIGDNSDDMTVVSEISADTPVVAAMQDGVVTQVSLTYHRSAALTSDGSLWMWGNNSAGQLGDGTIENKSTPVKVMDGVAQISLSPLSVALKKDGSLWAWGSYIFDPTGELTNYDYEDTPVKMMDGVVQISTCGNCYAAIKEDGSLWMWGEDQFGQLGYDPGSDPYEYKTIPVKVMEGVAQVSLNGNTSAAIKKDGSLWMWGYGENGELGDGTMEDKFTPVKVMKDVTQVSLGFSHSAAIKADGSLWMWGSNYFGQLGYVSTSNKHIPEKVMDGVAQVSLAGDCSAAIKADGSLWMWGCNLNGNLGDGTKDHKRSPVKIMDGVEQVSLTGDCSAAIKADGSLWIWGQGYKNTPERQMEGVAQVSLAAGFYAAIKKNGSLWMKGGNSDGQLGDGTTKGKSIPVQIFSGNPSGSVEPSPTMIPAPTGTVTPTPTETVKPEKRGYLPSVDGWGDINSNFAHHINKISKKSWNLVFKENWFTNKIYNMHNEGFSGVCKGLSIASALNYADEYKILYGGIFNSKPREVRAKDSFMNKQTNIIDGLTFSEWIQALYSWQWTKKAAYEARYNYEKDKEVLYREIIDKTKSFEKTHRYPISLTIGAKKDDGWVFHEVLPYKVVENKDSYDVYIYDCNYAPNENKDSFLDSRYIRFYINTNGEFTKWEYKSFGTVYKDYITYIGRLDLIDFSQKQGDNDAVFISNATGFSLRMADAAAVFEDAFLMDDADMEIIPVYQTDAGNALQEERIVYIDSTKDFSIQNENGEKSVTSIYADSTSDVTVTSDGQSTVDISSNSGKYFTEITPSRDEKTSVAFTTDMGDTVISVSGNADRQVKADASASDDNMIVSGYTDATIQTTSNGATVTQKLDNLSEQSQYEIQVKQGGVTTIAPVDSTCEHEFKETFTAATLKKNGAVTRTCGKCGYTEITAITRPEKMKLSAEKYTYNGKAKKPGVTVLNANGKKIAAKNYTVTYAKGRKNVGQYKVTVKFKGNYSGTLTKTFTIVPKGMSLSKLLAQKKGFKAVWKKQATQTSGYQIQYAVSSKFKGAKTKTVSGSQKTSVSVTKLTVKKTYYVRVRTYKTVKVNGKNTKLYSSWSKAKSVKTK